MVSPAGVGMKRGGGGGGGRGRERTASLISKLAIIADMGGPVSIDLPQVSRRTTAVPLGRGVVPPGKWRRDFLFEHFRFHLSSRVRFHWGQMRFLAAGYHVVFAQGGGSPHSYADARL